MQFKERDLLGGIKLLVSTIRDGCGDAEASFSLRLPGEQDVAISNDLAEELMLRAGIGTVVHEVDVERLEVRPRIQGFVADCRTVPTLDEAISILEKRVQYQKDDLDRKLAQARRDVRE